MKKYYAIQQVDRAADIYIFGDIVPWEFFPGDVSANGIVEQIKSLDADEIHVHIDSYGGSVSEGWAIYNALRQHPAKVTTYGDGFVASAALYPFLAGDKRVASNLSAYYFHRVAIAAEGYADELRKAADEAEQMTEIGIRAFVERAGMDESEVRSMMEAETWLTPTQALEHGLATSIIADSSLPVAQAVKKTIMQQVLKKDIVASKPKAETQESVPAVFAQAVGAPLEPTLKDLIKNMI